MFADGREPDTRKSAGNFAALEDDRLRQRGQGCETAAFFIKKRAIIGKIRPVADFLLMSVPPARDAL